MRDAPGVVYISSTLVQQKKSPFNRSAAVSSQSSLATGSGIVIDTNGTILTN